MQCSLLSKLSVSKFSYLKTQELNQFDSILKFPCYPNSGTQNSVPDTVNQEKVYLLIAKLQNRIDMDIKMYMTLKDCYSTLYRKLTEGKWLAQAPYLKKYEAGCVDCETFSYNGLRKKTDNSMRVNQTASWQSYTLRNEERLNLK